MSGGKVLSVAGVSKKFAADLKRSLGYGLRDIAREIAGAPRAPGLRPGEFWALEDISFEVAPGESLAVVGHNGAGKSTLLKILYGLLKPDAGEVRVRGRAQAIIELGTGFNGLLTGRENVEVGAALHGLGAAEAKRLLDQVVDFAELETFIDSPVQSYSSGMKARLSYALSAHLEPDLLLVDEVLAVGDTAFQRKCVNHMRRYLDGGGALLLVSHNTYQIQTLCNRGLLLDRGRVVYEGTAVDTLSQSFERRQNERPGTARALTSAGPVRILGVETSGPDGGAVHSGEAMRVRVLYHADEPIEVIWGFSVWSQDQWICIGGGNDLARHSLAPGEGVLSCTVPRLPLVGGRYAVRTGLLDADSGHALATQGVYDAGQPLVVREAPSAHTNFKMATNQLVNFDIEWG
jgi:ABC-type polysaccharide/polyol phosphate transport system ATPase subunit